MTPPSPQVHTFTFDVPAPPGEVYTAMANLFPDNPAFVVKAADPDAMQVVCDVPVSSFSWGEYLTAQARPSASIDEAATALTISVQGKVGGKPSERRRNLKVATEFRQSVEGLIHRMRAQHSPA